MKALTKVTPDCELNGAAGNYCVKNVQKLFAFFQLMEERRHDSNG